MTRWKAAVDRRSPAALPARGPAVYELRVLTTATELVESYRLRYETYRELGYLQRFNASRLEIDSYDRFSIPFGAFDARSGAMIGTLRLISTERQVDYAPLLERLVAELCDPELAHQALQPPARPLPAIASGDIDRQLAAFNPARFALHELSRFIVHPDHRSSHVSRGLVVLGIAHAMRSAPATIIAGCLPKHVRLYASYGFTKLPDTGLDHFDSVGQLANTIICRSDALPQPTRSHVDDLLRSMASGASEHTHELSRNSRALFHLAAPRRVRRRTMEW